MPDRAWRLRRVDRLPDARLAVVVGDGGRLLVVGDEALAQGLFVVVRALDERLTGDVVFHRHLGRVKQLVVAAAARRVDEAAGDAGDEQLVRDLELHDMVKVLVALLEHVIELLGLRRRAGEAVEHKALFALLVRVQLVLDHVDHDLVADEATRIHDLLGLLAEIRAHSYLLAEQVTGRKMADHVVEALENLGRLRTLTGARRADQDHAHAILHGALAL